MQPGAINVYVVRSNGNPIFGANVVLSSQSSSPITLTTGNDGKVTFGGVDPGTYTIVASGPGYADKTSDPLTLISGATLQVTLILEASGEAILDHFEFNTINGPETVGVPFTITIIAKDQRGDVLTSYNGVNTLDTLPNPDPLIQTPVVTPSSTTPFTQGRWVGDISLSSAGQSVTLKTNGGGKSGLSNSFEVMRSGYEPREPGGWSLPSYPVESLIIGFIISLFLIMARTRAPFRDTA